MSVGALLLRRSLLTVRNDTWEEFVEIRADLDAVLAMLLAEALGHGLDERWASVPVGRVIGALRMSLALPHGRGVGEILRDRVKDAHAINRRGRRPCGCGKLKSCTVEGIDARSLLEALACDEALDLDRWQIDIALADLQPRPFPAPVRGPAEYDRDGLEEAIVAALAAGDDHGMTVAELLEVISDQPQATSSRIGARLRTLRTQGVVADWTFKDGYFERRVWELARPREQHP